MGIIKLGYCDRCGQVGIPLTHKLTLTHFLDEEDKYSSIATDWSMRICKDCAADLHEAPKEEIHNHITTQLRKIKMPVKEMKNDIK